MYARSGLSRTDLLTILSEGRAPDDVQQITNEAVLRRSFTGITLLWEHNPRTHPRFPAAILVNEQEVRDLLAWLWTYGPELRPVTALTRVLSPSLAATSLDLAETPSLGELENAWLGVVVAEAVLTKSSRSILAKPSHHDCLSTSSLVQARASALGYSEDDSRALAKVCNRLRSQFSRDSRPEIESVFSRVWLILRQLARRDLFGTHSSAAVEPVVSALNDLIERRDIREETWSALTRRWSTLRESRIMSDASRELRVRLFEAFVGEAVNSSHLEEADAFLLAYLANQVSPGSLEHFQLFARNANVSSAVFAWYGFLAGLSSGTRRQGVLAYVGNRLVRDLLRRASIFDSPTEDIDMVEFDIAFESSRVERILLDEAGGQFSVGLLPGVSWTCFIPASSSTARETSKDSRIGEEVSEELKRLDRSIEDVRYAAARLFDRLKHSGSVSRGQPRPTKRSKD
jgi:hypothetical protein